ncbi:MAG: ABC transporter substrate-binding protein [Bacteriovoracaceae bacterium]
MKKWLSLVCVMILAGGLTACTKKKNTSEKVLNLVTPMKFAGYDPAFAADLYSGNETTRVYEGLLEYHYLKRPYTLQPNLAEAMPVVSADGLTYTFKILKGVKFHDSPAFSGGKGRELVAEDFVYSFKRLADPKLQSTGWWLLDGKIKGLNEWRKKYENAAAANYDDIIDGLKATDANTLVITLAKPFPQFLYALAMPFTVVVAKEAVIHFGKEFLNHPVGTAAFILPEYDQSNTITYLKNPNYREKTYPSDGEAGDKEKGLLESAGKKLPLVDKVVVQIMVEDQPRWLNLQKGAIDYAAIPKDNFSSTVQKDKTLVKELADKGMALEWAPQLDVTYIAFNHDNKLFKDNIKLRRAMSLAYDEVKGNELFYNGTGLSAQSVVPPGIAGYVADFKNPWRQFNLEQAKKLLAEAGYPGGKGLPKLSYDTTSNTVSRQMGEFFAKNMEELGIKIEVISNTWPELVKKTNNKSTMLFGIAWGADYPDAENFLQLLYCPNKAPGSNSSNYCNPEFDKLFAQASVMQDSPERTALYEQAYKLAADQVPWIFGLHRTNFYIRNGWLKNLKLTEFTHGQEKYLDVDTNSKTELSKKL